MKTGGLHCLLSVGEQIIVQIIGGDARIRGRIRETYYLLSRVARGGACTYAGRVIK